MSRHLADQRKPTSGQRLREFMRLARLGGNRLWMGMATRPATRSAAGPQGNRRMVEFLRIARGHQS